MGYSRVPIPKNNTFGLGGRPVPWIKDGKEGKGEYLVLGNDVKEPFREPQTESTLCLAGTGSCKHGKFGHIVRVTLQISIRDPPSK
jgi:hypothetical protein